MTARVHMRHLRALGYCARGAREWFALRGLDWISFVEAGIDAAELEATGDHFALEAARVAREEAAAHG